MSYVNYSKHNIHFAMLRKRCCRTLGLSNGKILLKVLILTLLTMIAMSCENILDDLAPSSEDKRTSNKAKVLIGETSPDFNIVKSDGTTFNLYTELASNDVVFYFTMWCSVCTGHADHMINSVAPSQTGVKFFVVDYVSSNLTDANFMFNSTGLSSTSFTMLLDSGNNLEDYFSATMGTTIVITKDKTIKMVEDYRNGTNLKTILDAR